jgi:hypothetical protein
MRLTLCLLLVLGGLTGCSTVSPQAGIVLDITAYRIEKLTDKYVDPIYGHDWKQWQNFLVFSNSNIRVRLARSAIAMKELHYGFDPHNLKLRWLKTNELLLISWTTMSQGTGGYTYDGNIILQVDGSQLRELFRDNIESVSKAGWSSQHFSSLKTAYNDENRTLHFTLQNTEINGDTKAPNPRYPFPFTETITFDDGQVGWRSEVTTMQTWDYRVAQGKLKFLRSNASVDLGGTAQPVEEIANNFHITRAKLDSMNPGLRAQTAVSGIVFVDMNCGPYKTSLYDGLDRGK